MNLHKTYNKKFFQTPTRNYLTLILIFGVLIVKAQSPSDTVFDPAFNRYRVVSFKKLNNEIKSVSNTVSIERPYTLYIPNAFSPDGDGINDYFRIWGQGINDIEVEIYNRWGQMVFKSFNMNEMWDGKFNDKLSPSGTYVYRVKSKNSNSEEYLESGTVSLVR